MTFGKSSMIFSSKNLNITKLAEKFQWLNLDQCSSSESFHSKAKPFMFK